MMNVNIGSFAFKGIFKDKFELYIKNLFLELCHKRGNDKGSER